MKIAQMKSGETALVIGATGGTGTSLVPLLAQAGIYTIATASSAEKSALMSRLGANAVIGHDPAGYPQDVDVVFDLALFGNGIGQAAKCLRPGGKMVSIVFPPATAQNLGRDDVDFRFMLDEDGEYGGMQDVADAAEAGTLTVEIAHVFPFERAVEAAVTYATARAAGEVVVIFSAPA